MILSVGRCLFATTFLALSVSSVHANEEMATPGIVDQAGLFRPETIARADATIRKLRSERNFDVIVETVASLPDVDPIRKSSYFRRLSQERAKKADINGLYILICTNPRYVYVTAYPDSLDSIFSRFKQDDLKKTLAKRLREAHPGDGHRDDVAQAAAGFGWRGWRMLHPSGPDAALLDALTRVNTVLREQAGDPNAVRAWPVIVLLATGPVLWLILFLVQRRLADRVPDAGLHQPDRSHRMSGFLASLFGTPAAYWIYDRLFFATSDKKQPPLSSPASPIVRETAIMPDETLVVSKESLASKSVADTAAHDSAS